MAQRKRRRRKPVEIGDLTFFSFQDIMTCVTGIMLLLTLMMTLLNAQQPAVAEIGQMPAASTDDEQAKQSIASLHATEEAKRANTARLAAGMDAVHAMIAVTDPGETAAGLNRVLVQLPELMQASAGRIAEGRTRLLALDDRLRALKASTQDVERRTVTFSEAALKAAKELTFLPGRQDARPVLVDMTAGGSTVGILDPDGRPRQMATPAAGQELDAICAAADGLKPDKAAVVLLVRPDAVGRFHDLSDAIRGRNLTVGWDAAPTGPVFPKKEAANAQP